MLKTIKFETNFTKLKDFNPFKSVSVKEIETWFEKQKRIVYF